MELVKLIPVLCMLLGPVLMITKASDENCTCGQWYHGERRIADGISAKSNEFPMMAGMININSKNIFCGAAILTEKHVLTAAHCIGKYKYKMDQLGVAVGEDDIKQENETDVTQFYKVVKAVIHPNFDPETNNNDVAVATSESEFQFSKKVGLACLPYTYEQKPRDIVIELGWGFTHIHTIHREDSLQKLRTYVLAPEECNREDVHINYKNLLCTAIGRSGTCHNDAGGPVIWRNITSDKWILVGVISMEGCGLMPSVNMPVKLYLDFIESTTPGFKYCKFNI